MKIKGVDFVFYNVTDMQKALGFYRDTLGLKVLGEVGEKWNEFDTGNVTLSLGVYGAKPNKKGEKGNVSIALAVDDLAKAMEELKNKGVPVSMDLQDFPACGMAAIFDPDGNEVVLHQRKDGTVG